MAGIGVSVGVEFILDLWLVTIHISVEISARLHLQGPPFGGVVYVDFWVFGFDIPFGDQIRGEDAIELERFWRLLQSSPESGPAGIGKNAHVFSIDAGIYTQGAAKKTEETKEGEGWEINSGGFVFRVVSRIPIQRVNDEFETIDTGPTRKWEIEHSQSFYAKPMHLVNQLISEMFVVITKNTTKADVTLPTTTTITVSTNEQPVLDAPEGESAGKFQFAKVLSKVPTALWGQCESPNFPNLIFIISLFLFYCFLLGHNSFLTHVFR